MTQFFDNIAVAILSTDLLVGQTGIFHSKEISLEVAKNIIAENGYMNYVSHNTVSVLGVDPAEGRPVCPGYDHAIVLKINGRLEFGREYTNEEIENIGYTIMYIRRWNKIPRSELMDIINSEGYIE